MSYTGFSVKRFVCQQASSRVVVGKYNDDALTQAFLCFPKPRDKGKRINNVLIHE